MNIPPEKFDTYVACLYLVHCPPASKFVQLSNTYKRSAQQRQNRIPLARNILVNKRKAAQNQKPLGIAFYFKKFLLMLLIYVGTGSTVQRIKRNSVER